MEANQNTCSVCNKATEAEHLIYFGEDAVCADCKDEYVQCLREGAELSSRCGIWRDGGAVLCEPKAPLTDCCIRCNQPASCSRSLPYTEGRSAFTLHIPQLSKTEIMAGFCLSCNQQVERYSRVRALGLILLGIGYFPMGILGWIDKRWFINHKSIFYILVGFVILGILTWGFRLFFMWTPSARFQRKTGLLRIKGAGRRFIESLPMFPGNGLGQHN